MSLPSDDRDRTGSKARRIRVAVTGTESSGKSTLIAELSGSLGWPAIPESARTLVEALGRGLELADLPRLVAMHRTSRARALQRARRREAPGILLDTDLYSSWVYAAHYMGAVPDWLKRSARQGSADLYLYCEADIPLAPDPGQRGSAADRRAVDADLSVLLQSEGRRVVRISGSRTHRVRLATRAIATVLTEGPNTEWPGPL